MPNEKNSASVGDLVGRQRGPWDLDHGADQVLDLDAGLLHLLLGHRDGPLLDEDQLLDRADQRDHDLGQDGLTPLLDRDRGVDDRADLHLADLRIDDRQPAAAEAQHGIELVELLDALADLLGGDAELFRDLLLAPGVVGQEFVKRRVEQADRHGQAVHRLEDPDEIPALEWLELG